MNPDSPNYDKMMVNALADYRKENERLKAENKELKYIDEPENELQKQCEDYLKLMQIQHIHIPDGAAKKLHQPWDDGISSLVMLSGEALSIHGEGLAKFKLAQFSGAAIIAPVRVKDQPIGVISVGRKAPRPFTERHMVMLEAVADYASISLVNARLFEALEDRAQRLEREIQRSTERDQVDAKWLRDVHRSLRAAQAEIASLMSKRQAARLSKELGTVMHDIESVLDGISNIVEERSGDSTP